MALRNEGWVVCGQRVDPVKTERARELRARSTSAEQKLWYYLRSRRLGGLHFRRQQVIDGFIIDFYCHAARLAVELDGAAHDTQADYDSARDEELFLHGISVLRFANEQVAQTVDDVLAQILQACRQHTENSPLSLDAGELCGK